MFFQQFYGYNESDDDTDGGGDECCPGCEHPELTAEAQPKPHGLGREHRIEHEVTKAQIPIPSRVGHTIEDQFIIFPS